MRRPINRWGYALVMLAGTLAACSRGASEETAGQEKLVEEAQRELDAASSADPATFSSVRPVRPVLKCIDRLGGNQFRAHFGYVNAAPATVTIPVGFFNRFWPAPINRGQPTTFAPGSQDDVVQVTLGGFSASIWVLGSHLAIATRFSRPCPGGGTGGDTGAGGNTGAGGMLQCPSNCDDHNPCTIEICGVNTGFQCVSSSVADGTPCEDGNHCTLADTCQAGVCVFGVPVGCSPADQCHVSGACDPATGICSLPVPRPDGTRCDAGPGCSFSGACEGGACVCVPPDPVVCGPIFCPLGQVCCNASCGICTPPGGVCIQAICDPLPPTGGPCATDSDCRAFSDYCTGCDCRSLSVCEKDPVCPGPGVQCLLDPCGGQQAFCSAGRCELRPQPPQCALAACGPPLGLPNFLCPDGKTVAGPTGRCLGDPAGTCGWEVISCPDPRICGPGAPCAAGLEWCSLNGRCTNPACLSCCQFGKACTTIADCGPPACVTCTNGATACSVPNCGGAEQLGQCQFPPPVCP